MKFNTSALIWTFLWSLFMGVTAIAIGFGALFPSMNLISKPFVCPNGKMDHVDQVYNPYPGTTITTITWYCIDSRGGKTELGIFPMSLYAGLIYGVLLFLVIIVGMAILGRYGRSRSGIGDTGESVSVEKAEKFRRQTEQFREQRLAQIENKSESSRDALEKMKELKRLREANLISEAEYQSKRAEILKEL